MHTLTINGAKPESDWDHPPFETEDDALIWSYGLSVLVEMEKDPTAPRSISIDGKSYDLEGVAALIYLLGDERDLDLLRARAA